MKNMQIAPFETSALLSKGSNAVCEFCGNKGHTKEKCWQLIGYPSWHPRSKKLPQKKGPKSNFAGQSVQKEC